MAPECPSVSSDEEEDKKPLGTPGEWGAKQKKVAEAKIALLEAKLAAAEQQQQSWPQWSQKAVPGETPSL
mgnify:CR=1 FL=1